MPLLLFYYIIFHSALQTILAKSTLLLPDLKRDTQPYHKEKANFLLSPEKKLAPDGRRKGRMGKFP